jgi:hypothetical protein
MKIKVSKEEFVLNKALHVLQEANFPDVRVGYIVSMPEYTKRMSVLVFEHGDEVYWRNITINSIGASVRELPCVTNGEFRTKWIELQLEEDEFILFLDDFSRLIPEDAFKNEYEITVEL